MDVVRARVRVRVTLYSVQQRTCFSVGSLSVYIERFLSPHQVTLTLTLTPLTAPGNPNPNPNPNPSPHQVRTPALTLTPHRTR